MIVSRIILIGCSMLFAYATLLAAPAPLPKRDSTITTIGTYTQASGNSDNWMTFVVGGDYREYWNGYDYRGRWRYDYGKHGTYIHVKRMYCWRDEGWVECATNLDGVWCIESDGSLAGVSGWVYGKAIRKR